MNPLVRNVIVLIFVSVIVIGFIVAVISVFRGDSSSANLAPMEIELKNYLDKDATAIYTVKGPIVASEEYREIKVYISPTKRRLEIIQGYQGRVIDAKTFGNDREAYRQFMLALTSVGFTKKDFDAEPEIPDGSICPFSTKVTYQLKEGGSTVYNAWSAEECKSKQSFEGKVESVEKLFEAQIPEYSELTSDVSFE